MSFGKMKYWNLAMDIENQDAFLLSFLLITDKKN
jgi:hypothetical protein